MIHRMAIDVFLSIPTYDLKVRDETIFDTITRKVREWITAVQIEQTYTKNEIIEMYFNTHAVRFLIDFQFLSSKLMKHLCYYLSLF